MYILFYIRKIKSLKLRMLISNSQQAAVPLFQEKNLAKQSVYSNTIMSLLKRFC